QTFLMCLFPCVGQIRMHFIMGISNQVWIAASIVRNPALTRGDIAHVPIEHGNTDGCFLDQGTQLFLICKEYILSMLAFTNIAIDADIALNVSIFITQCNCPSLNMDLRAVFS